MADMRLLETDHQRAKLRMQSHRMIAHIQPEVRSIRHSRNSNLPHRPPKPTFAGHLEVSGLNVGEP